ncbi:hypothetical protein LTS10_008216 [Elasticomyces elasticus]|nr:hypothetical protein LTS10_008216 [Elasticomyces elasticus]
MKACTIATAVALLTSSTFAASVHKRDAVSDKFQAVNVEQLTTAVSTWLLDTQGVSDFFNDAANAVANADTFDTTQTSLPVEANDAFQHETNETSQKGIIEGFLCLDTACTSSISSVSIQAAKELLENGAFQSVLDQLNRIDGQGAPNIADVSDAINIINNGNSTTDGRCAGVLFAIDTYFRAASDVIDQLGADNLLTGLEASRPLACNGISALSQVAS